MHRAIDQGKFQWERLKTLSSFTGVRPNAAKAHLKPFAALELRIVAQKVAPRAPAPRRAISIERAGGRGSPPRGSPRSACSVALATGCSSVLQTRGAAHSCRLLQLLFREPALGRTILQISCSSMIPFRARIALPRQPYPGIHPTRLPTARQSHALKQSLSSS